VQDSLSHSADGQRLLGRLREDPHAAASTLESWLRSRSTELPPSVANYVSGGRVDHLVNIAQVGVLQLPPLPTLSAAERQAQRNREYMLNRVQRVWIEGVLEHSVAGAAPLAIGLEYRPGGVTDRWSDVIPTESRAGQPLPAGATLVTAFDALDAQMLVLGTPGSGKTTLLLELARVLIERSRSDAALPLPIVLPLAPWANRRSGLGAWLIEELVQRYDAPRRLAESWVSGDQILPLLDGLDEVPAPHRAACVDAINAFQAQRQRAVGEIVVTCRADEYAALGVQLKVAGAVALLPVADPAIETYLAAAGPELEGVRRALDGDPTLRALMASPLLLDVITRTYRGADAASLPVSGDPEERLGQVFAAYVTLMLARRGGAARYQPVLTRAWLGWVARALRRQSQTVLYVERLQPDWLTASADRVLYTVLDRGGFGLALGAIEGLIVGSLVSWTAALAVGAVSTIAIALAGRTTYTHRGPRRLARAFVLGGVVTGLASAVLAAPFSDANGMLSMGILGAGLGAPAAGLGGGPGIRQRSVNLVERFRWSPSRAMVSGLGGLATIVLLGPPLVFIAVLQNGDSPVLTGLAVALLVGLPPAVLGAIVGAFDDGDLDEQARMRPNQGIRRSASTAARVALASGVAAGLVFGVLGPISGAHISVSFLTGPLSGVLAGLNDEWRVGLFLAAVVGSVYGLLGGLAYGGYACLSHYALRLAMWRRGCLPLDCVAFLNFAADRVLLRKVGGGYMFVHRRIQDYFADAT